MRLSDLATLRDQPELYGPVASDPTACSSTAADHIEVLTEAITQIPDPRRRDLLITVDGAGATLDLISHSVHGRRVHHLVGFDLDHRARTAIGHVRERDWQHVWDRDGELATWTASTAPAWSS